MKILLSFCVRAFLVIAAVAAVDAGRVAADPREIDALSAQSRRLMFDSKIDEAIPLAEQALAMAEKQLGKETAKYAQLANRLAVLYRSKSRFGEAEQLLKHAIAVREAADPNQLVDSLNDLGLIYWDTGRYAEAEPLLQRCLEQYATRRGPKHEYTATAATNLALLYRDMGRFDDAERYMLQGKGIREELAAPVRDVELSNSLNNLAGLLRERGRYAEAEPLARQAVEIRTRVHGLEHRDVATSMNVLAEILRATGQYAEAETLLGTTLSIRRARLGAEDVRVASSLNSLGGVYEGLGRLKEAEAAYQQGLQIREKHLKATYPNHPDIATSQANLGALLKSQFRYTEAEPLLRSALDIRERTLGAAHPDTLKSMIQLADLVRARGRKSEADQLFDRALSIRRSAVKQVDVHFATNRNKLTNTKTLAFGSERANRLTFGLANVWVPTEITADKAKTQPAMAKAGGATPPTRRPRSRASISATRSNCNSPTSCAALARR